MNKMYEVKLMGEKSIVESLGKLVNHFGLDYDPSELDQGQVFIEGEEIQDNDDWELFIERETREIFKSLEGLNFENGVKIVRGNFTKSSEQSNKLGFGGIDFDFKIAEGLYFTYTTTFEEVKDDEDSVDLENGYWALMAFGNHYTDVS